MKRTGKRIVVLVMMLSLVIATACSSKSNSNEQSPTSVASPTASGQATEGQSAVVKEEYVIKVLANTQSASQIKRSDETKIGKIVKEKFNIVIEYIQSPGNYADKLNLMLAGGDYPEIIAIQDNDTFDKYVRAGALLPLDDFVNETPDFAQRYSKQIPLWKLSAHDSKLYKWEGAVPVDFNNMLEVNDIGVRTDALEQQGWPDLLSTDDYIAFLKQALADNPTTNGQKTLGMIVPFAEPWGMQGIGGIMYEKGGRYSTAAGNLGVIWNQVDERYEDMMKNEYVKENMQFFNKLYREGILDKDAFTDKYDQFSEKMNSGRALSSWYVVWGLSATNQGLIEAGQPNLQYINMPVRSMTQIERNEKRQIRVEDTRPFAIYAITKNAKHPERIKELLAYSASEEGRILFQSGIEGEEYTIENGKRVPTETYKESAINIEEADKIGFGMFSFLGDVYTNAPDGVPYTMSLDPAFQDELILTDRMKNAYTELGWSNSKEYWLETGESAHTGVAGTISIDTTSELGALHQKIVDFRTKNFAKLIVTPKTDEEFETLYQSTIKEYEKLSPEKIEDEYNRLYQEKKAQLDQLK